MNIISKYLLVFVLYVSMPSAMFSQMETECNTKDWKQDILKKYPSKSIFNEFTKENNLDFSSIWLDTRANYLGYLSPNYQKLDISINKIQKQSSIKYKVTGKSLIESDECNFDGIITLIDVRELNEVNTGIDNEGLGKVKKEGYILAKFILNEDKKQQKTRGKFVGILFSKWYIDNNNVLFYDDIDDYTDDYFNNQFLGVWINRKTKETKMSAWGQYRIPCSGDLDIGAGEFSPNPKYKNSGWVVIDKLN